MDGIGLDVARAPATAPCLASDLRAALAAGGAGLRIDLQPICAAATLAPVGYEALLRWEHPALGAIPPIETFALAEANGALVALESWALLHAFRLRAAWSQGGPYLSVNVSSAALLSGQAAAMLRTAFSASGANPRGVVIELPEAAVARDLRAARELAAEIRALGASVALDDFGSTHGSARMLRDIPFGSVKLDAALTDGLDGDGVGAARALAMVGAVVDMAHAMGATVIAEAVESAAQMRALRDAGCDALQGWLLGSPAGVT